MKKNKQIRAAFMQERYNIMEQMEKLDSEKGVSPSGGGRNKSEKASGKLVKLDTYKDSDMLMNK